MENQATDLAAAPSLSGDEGDEPEQGQDDEDHRGSLLKGVVRRRENRRDDPQLTKRVSPPHVVWRREGISGRMDEKTCMEQTKMTTQVIEIVDRGRGPQLSTSRLTVLDVFYYLHRGYDFEFIQQVMPSLTRAEFAAVHAYVNQHHDELAEKDRLIEERNQRGIAEQQARGLPDIDRMIPVAERAARLREKVRQRQRDHAEKNGGHAAH